jgi:hypothetical protein
MPYDVMPGLMLDKKLKEPWVEYLDGNHALVKLQDYTPDGGLMIASKKDGRPVIPDHVPTKIRLRDGHPDRPLQDFEDSAVCMMISTAAKSLIEELEPGAHQFFPVEVFAYNNDPATWQDVYGNFDPVPEGTLKDRKVADRWFFVICNRLDAMNRELTVGITEKGIYRPEKVGVEGKLILNRGAVGNAQSWCDRCVRGLFFSDKLIERADAMGLTGLQRRTFIEAV